MRRRLLPVLTLVAGSLTAACTDDPLAITNLNQPSTEALISSATGTETIISKLMQQMHQGQYGSSDAIWVQSSVMSYENNATVANFGMQVRAQIPRNPIDNTPNNAVQAGNLRDYSFVTRNAVLAARALNAIREFESAYTPADLARNRAFAFFALGYGMGHVSLVYDSASIITPATVEDSPIPYSPYPQVNAAALALLDSAITIAQSPAATSGSGWNLPAGWLSSPTTGLTRDQFVQLVRSIRARVRSNVARTPAERAAVNWASVLADAQGGIQQDLVIQLGSGRGWTNAYLNQAAVPGGWSQMPYWVIGMADTTGAYQTWLQEPLSARNPFLVVTPDRRFPRGETRAAQQDFQAPRTPSPGVYFRNRPAGDDTPGAPGGLTWYDNFRYYEINTNNTVGQWQLITRAENELTAAEALIRLNRVAEAVPLINRTRTLNGLPALPAAADTTQRVPGGNACVPRIPVRSGTTVTTVCGNVWEAMKYEKRIETAFNGYASWFMNGRGWGDLLPGTPLEWPIPYQETDARLLPTHQNRRVATGPGTYGFLP